MRSGRHKDFRAWSPLNAVGWPEYLLAILDPDHVERFLAWMARKKRNMIHRVIISGCQDW